MIRKLQLHHIVDDIQTGIHSEERREYMSSYARSARVGASTLVKNGINIAWRALDDRLIQSGKNTSKASKELIQAWTSLRFMAKLPTMMFAYDQAKANSHDDIVVVKTGTIAAQVRR